MKKIKKITTIKYICPECGTAFNKEEHAQECLDSHIPIEELKIKSISKYNKWIPKFPKTIEIGNDNALASYQLKRIYDDEHICINDEAIKLIQE